MSVRCIITPIFSLNEKVIITVMTYPFGKVALIISVERNEEINNNSCYGNDGSGSYGSSVHIYSNP